MLKALPICIIFLSCCFLSYIPPQENNRIMVKATGMGTEFYLDITASKKRSKIIYKVRDSILKAFTKDENFKAYQQALFSIKQINLKNDTVLYLLKRLDSITQHYTIYSVDSIIISGKKNNIYKEIIENAISSSNEILDNNNKNRISIDGTSFEILLSNKHSTRTVYAQSPTAESHPLLYSLISETMNLYRTRDSNKSDFLNKKRTKGY